MKCVFSTGKRVVRNDSYYRCNIYLVRSIQTSEKQNVTRYENKSIKQEIENKHSRDRLAKKLLDGKYYKKASPLPIKSQFDDIRKNINLQCKTISEIYRILQSPTAKKKK
eukprot:339715_1